MDRVFRHGQISVCQATQHATRGDALPGLPETEKQKLMTKLAATIPQSVEISGLSRSAIYRAAKEGKLTIRKNGGRSLILLSDLQAFLQSLPAAEA